VEGGLGQPPLPPPQRVVTRKQAIPRDGAQKLELKGRFGVVAVVVLKNVLDVIGVVGDEDSPEADGVLKQIAVARRDLHQRGEGRLAQGVEVAGGDEAARARRWRGWGVGKYGHVEG
jgi:hypothetical protein